MTRLFLLFFATVFLMPQMANAQETAYGFRVGLNSSTFLGDKEMGMNGTTFESFGTNTGFHVGGGMRIKFTDLFGIRAELLFTQKGSKINFEGESFQIFRSDSGNEVFAIGNKNMTLDISNAYLEIPVMAYGKLGEKLEFYGGVYAGFLISSTATGQLIFNGNSAVSNNPINETFTLDYNYYKDDVNQDFDGESIITFMADGQTINLPERLSAYFDLEEKNNAPYNILDMGAAGGIAFYLNTGLFVSATATYGFLDVSNDDMDFSKTESQNNSYVTRADKDKNFSLQFSVGFSF